MRLAIWAVLLSSLVATEALAAETRLLLDYDVRFGPLRLVEMHITVDLEDKRYRAESEMRTVGITGYLFPWTSSARCSGLRADGALRPQQFRSRGVYRREQRSVEIDYAESGAVSARVEPAAEGDWRDAVPPEVQRGTIDPLSASLATMESNCAGSVHVFDGRRRYNLTFTDLGQAEVEAASRQVYTGPARRCRATIEALVGFWRGEHRATEAPTTLDFWIAPPRPGAPPLPVYLELHGARGTLGIHLTGVGEVS